MLCVYEHINKKKVMNSKVIFASFFGPKRVLVFALDLENIFIFLKPSEFFGPKCVVFFALGFANIFVFLKPSEFLGPKCVVVYLR